MSDKMCSHCELDTAGNHASGCPLNPSNSQIFTYCEYCLKLEATCQRLRELAGEVWCLMLKYRDESYYQNHLAEPAAMEQRLKDEGVIQ